MVQYLIILLDNSSVSYCHYESCKASKQLISLENLRSGIFYAMKENLMIQFVYPDYELPEEYKRVIETIDHNKIMPASLCTDADVVICNGFNELANVCLTQGTNYVLRLCKTELFTSYKELIPFMDKIIHLSIVITDVDTFDDTDFKYYKDVLSIYTESINNYYNKGCMPQLNILTDRILLKSMNNCNAGFENITLAPNGKFYVCPAFYMNEDGYCIGDLGDGWDIKNPQLYKLSHAPICQLCDAYQCKRCIWLNYKTTLEVNTPSHEQCVVGHLERNASRQLLSKLKQSVDFFADKEIKEINYLDPFSLLKD